MSGTVLEINGKFWSKMRIGAQPDTKKSGHETEGHRDRRYI